MDLLTVRIEEAQMVGLVLDDVLLQVLVLQTARIVGKQSRPLVTVCDPGKARARAALRLTLSLGPLGLASCLPDLRLLDGRHFFVCAGCL